MASDDKPSHEAPTRVERSSPTTAVPELPISPTARDPRYAAGDEIARGGMGRVLEATDTMLGRVVAIKEALALDPEALRRFARETKITARLEHPSIIPVYDAGRTANGTPFYVMRKVGGRPLDKLVQESDFARRLALVPHVLAAVDAIAHAHGRGVVHRDVKPSNILAGELGETIVIDWGLAKVIDEPADGPDDDHEPGDSVGRPAMAARSLGDSLRTRVGAVIGTPGFMSPRQLTGARATPACDVYALGATLYYVLAGRSPHASRDPDTTVALALAGPPVPVAQIAPGVPPELAAIVARAMHYDTRERYPDAAALGVDLRNFLSGQLVAAHHYSTRERLTRFASRHRAAITVSLIAVVAIVVIARLAIVSILRERDAATAAQEQASLEKRAAVEARRREAERADELLVAQATALVATNPIAAVGLLHQLPAGSAQWLAARGVLAEARRRGVPWALPASRETVGLALSSDGNVAYSGGGDGVVRRHDLATGAASALMKLSAPARLVLVPGRDSTGDALAIATNTAELTWYGLRDGRTSVVPLPVPIDLFDAGPNAVVWSEAGGALWMLAPGDTAPRKLPSSLGKLGRLDVSPTGKHVVVGSDGDTAVIELGATPRVVFVRGARVFAVAWSGDGSRLALAGQYAVDELDVSVEPARAEQLGTGFAPVLAYDGDDLYFGGSDGRIYQRIRGRIVDIGAPNDNYGAAIAVRDAVAFVATTGIITVLGRGVRASIRAPVSSLYRSAGRASRLVVGAADYLLAYDLSAVMPRRYPAVTGNTYFHGFVGDEFLQAYLIEPWKLFDAAKGTARTLPKYEFPKLHSIAPDGSYLLVHHEGKGEVELIRRDGTRTSLHPDASGAIARSPTHVALIVGREIREVDLQSGAQRRLHLADDPIEYVRSDGAYLLAATRKQLWRHDTTTDTAAELALPASTLVGIEVAPTGEAYAAMPRRILRWNRDGTTGDVAVPERTLKKLLHVHGVGLLAKDDADVQWLVGGPVARRAFPDGVIATSIAKRAPLATALADKQVVVHDLLGERAWTLGAGEHIADLSEDGRYVATYGTDRIAIYTVELPADRAAFDKLLDAATNLRTRGTANELVWPK